MRLQNLAWHTKVGSQNGCYRNGNALAYLWSLIPRSCEELRHKRSSRGEWIIHVDEKEAPAVVRPCMQKDGGSRKSGSEGGPLQRQRQNRGRQVALEPNKRMFMIGPNDIRWFNKELAWWLYVQDYSLLVRNVRCWRHDQFPIVLSCNCFSCTQLSRLRVSYLVRDLAFLTSGPTPMGQCRRSTS